jgi:hypothetical protein
VSAANGVHLIVTEAREQGGRIDQVAEDNDRNPTHRRISSRIAREDRLVLGIVGVLDDRKPLDLLADGEFREVARVISSLEDAPFN